MYWTFPLNTSCRNLKFLKGKIPFFLLNYEYSYNISHSVCLIAFQAKNKFFLLKIYFPYHTLITIISQKIVDATNKSSCSYINRNTAFVNFLDMTYKIFLFFTENLQRIMRSKVIFFLILFFISIQFCFGENFHPLI